MSKLWDAHDRIMLVVGVLCAFGSFYYTRATYLDAHPPSPSAGVVMTAPIHPIYPAMMLGALAIILLLLAAVGMYRRSQNKLPASIEDKFSPAAHVPDWTISQLFSHLHAVPFASDADKELVGQEIIDEFSTGRLSVWGRRILDSKRLPLASIPAEVWQNGAKFTYWFLDDQNGLSLDVSCRRPSAGSADWQYADLRVNRVQAETIWRWLPLKEAARMAYEQTRNTFISGVAERFGKTGDGILHYFASSMFIYQPIYAQRIPSTVRELIPGHERGALRVFDDCDAIGHVSGREPIYIGATIKKSDLDVFIEWAKTTSLQAEPG